MVREAARVFANQEAGVLFVRATAKQHEVVQRYLDGVMASARRQVLIEATVAEITKYASTDLLCFRAPDPDDLVAAQAAAWDPLLAWAEEALGAHLVPATGVLPIDQDPVALTLIHNRAQELDRWRLAAVAQATALTGSAVLGFALLESRIDGEQAFALSTLDEHYQASQWGEDAEAKERLDNLKIEILAVERLLRGL